MVKETEYQETAIHLFCGHSKEPQKLIVTSLSQSGKQDDKAVGEQLADWLDHYVPYHVVIAMLAKLSGKLSGGV